MAHNKNTETLFLVLRRAPFELVACGIKKEEYRDIKPFWTNRLLGRNYRYVCFQLGYQRDARRVTVEFLGTRMGKPKAEWSCGLFPPDRCYIIQLGKIINYQNQQQ